MHIAETWRRVHTWRRRTRWPLKIGLFVITLFLVLFPKVWLVPTWVERLRNLNSVLDPNNAALAPLERQVEAEVGPRASLDATVHAVQHAVYAAVPYAFDWDTWGVMDYLPTVSEVFARGREDCDGQAVVAASLLRRLGYDAWLVTDLKHMWVAARERNVPNAPVEQTMSPGEGGQSLVGGEAGTHASLADLVPNVLRSLAFGVAVFPLRRELIIAATLCLLTMQPRSSVVRRLAGCGAILVALMLLRWIGPAGVEHPVTTILAVVGVIVAAVGWLLLAVKGGAYRSQPGPPESPAGDGVDPG